MEGEAGGQVRGRGRGEGSRARGWRDRAGAEMRAATELRRCFHSRRKYVVLRSHSRLRRASEGFVTESSHSHLALAAAGDAMIHTYIHAGGRGEGKGTG